MSLFTKIEAKWTEPVAFRRARADYERGRPIDLRKRAVIVFGAMGTVSGIALHSLNELVRHPELAAAIVGIALLVGLLYMPMRGYLLANVDARVRLNKEHIERSAAFGLKKDKWLMKEIKDFEFTTGRNCELLLIEMQDGTRAFFGIPAQSRANIQNNLRAAFKESKVDSSSRNKTFEI